MLTLTRKVGDVILIGPDIRVEVRMISGRHVRIGIVAPPEVNIVRAEIADDRRGDAHDRVRAG